MIFVDPRPSSRSSPEEPDAADLRCEDPGGSGSAFRGARHSRNIDAICDDLRANADRWPTDRLYTRSTRQVSLSCRVRRRRPCRRRRFRALRQRPQEPGGPEFRRPPGLTPAPRFMARDSCSKAPISPTPISPRRNTPRATADDFGHPHDGGNVGAGFKPAPTKELRRLDLCRIYRDSPLDNGP